MTFEQLKKVSIDVESYKKHVEELYCGKIHFLGSGGEIGETIYYKDIKEFEKEVKDSQEVGRPISFIKLHTKEPLEKHKSIVKKRLKSMSK